MVAPGACSFNLDESAVNLPQKLPVQRAVVERVCYRLSETGDSDTLAAIIGSMAEARWGVPKEIADEALVRLDSDLRIVYKAFINQV